MKTHQKDYYTPFSVARRIVGSTVMSDITKSHISNLVTLAETGRSALGITQNILL